MAGFRELEDENRVMLHRLLDDIERLLTEVRTVVDTKPGGEEDADT